MYRSVTNDTCASLAPMGYRGGENDETGVLPSPFVTNICCFC